MALKSCRSCSREVSEDAAQCPHCGAAAPTRVPSTEWAPCSKCGSAKTQPMGFGMLGLTAFAGGGCMMWIPIIGWVIAPVLFLFALALWIAALLPAGKAAFQCQDCKGWFQVPKRELAGESSTP